MQTSLHARIPVEISIGEAEFLFVRVIFRAFRVQLAIYLLLPVAFPDTRYIKIEKCT